MNKLTTIAIFDIGKTNKKFFLLDESYAIVYERSTPFEEIKDEDGDACDNIERLGKWLISSLEWALKSNEYTIKAVNFSAYGASLVYIDERGEVIAPLYNYLKKYPVELKEGLYAKYGGAQKISLETASPVLDSLNSGMQLYRVMKEKPELYQQTKFALHLPQFASFLVSKKACSDITSIGCHTQLWNFQTDEYHKWVKQEGLDKKLAPIQPANHAAACSFYNRSLLVGTGLHDSSAALIPYLAVFAEPFILLSTGTWCISLNPFNATSLTAAELEKDCLCYKEYQGKPVKASRLFAGYEHEQQIKRLAAHFNQPPDSYKKIKYEAAVIAGLQEAMNRADDQTTFADRDLSRFANYNEAYHGLMLDIIRRQYHSTQLVIKGSVVNRIFVDGGFSNNSVYMHLLAAVFPKMEVYAASVAQATAMGAALAIHEDWNSLPVPADMVKLKFYKVAESLPVPA